MSNMRRGIEEPVLALVDRWIIDYFSRIVWRHFEEQGTVVSDWIDGFMSERKCIQVLETQPGDNLDLLELHSRLLIQFMCRISGGSFGTTIVNNDSEDDRTELEDAIELLEQIIAVGNHDFSATDLLRIRISVKQQAVYACCREGNFDLAAKVFFRQWKSWKTREEMAARKNIAEVLDSRNHIHDHLKSLTYESTINDCKHILRKIFNNMAPPFLVTAAKNVWERMKTEDTIKVTDSDNTDVMKVKREQNMDKTVLFNRQTDYDMSEALVNEICARNGSMHTSTSSVPGLQILSDAKQQEIYAPSQTLVTMMPGANKSDTFPLILWTNSISSNVLSPAVSSASVQTSEEAKVTVSNSFTQQRNEVGPQQRMYLNLSSNQFSLPEEIYLNTVPVVSSQVYANTPMFQQPGSLVDSGSVRQMWSVPASTAANVDMLSDTEPAVKLGRSRKRGRKKVNAKAFETSFLPTAPINQPLPLRTEAAKISPTIKQMARPRVTIKSSAQNVTQVIEDKPRSVVNEVLSSRATEAKCPRTTPSLPPQPKRKRPFRKSKTQVVSGSERDLASEKFPVVCLTKISSQALQKKLPSTEISNKPRSSRSMLQAAGIKHAQKDSFNKGSDYFPETMRKSRNSSVLSSPQESLHRTDRNSKVCRDLRSPAESIGNKRNRSGSPAKKQVAYSGRLVPNESSIILSSQIQSTPKKSNRAEKAAWSPRETEKLYKAVQKYGRHWARITRCQFPDRAPMSVYNKWKSILNGKELKLLQQKLGSI